MNDAHEIHLPEAVRPTALATRNMAEGRTPQVSRALIEIAEHFFELDYQVADLRKKAGGSDRFAEVFQRSVGLTPWRFIQECRMETAARLMPVSTLSMEDVAFLVGYQAAAPFWRLSQRWCNMAPEVLRAHLRPLHRQLEALPDDAFAWHFWHRCARGELAPHETAPVITHLEAVLASAEQEELAPGAPSEERP